MLAAASTHDIWIIVAVVIFLLAAYLAYVQNYVGAVLCLVIAVVVMVLGVQ